MPPNKRFNEQSNSCARALQIFVHFLPFSTKQQRQMTKFCVVYGTQPTTGILSYFYLELNAVITYLACARLQGHQRTKQIFRRSRILLVKYKFSFYQGLYFASPPSLLKLPEGWHTLGDQLQGLSRRDLVAGTQSQGLASGTSPLVCTRILHRNSSRGDHHVVSIAFAFHMNVTDLGTQAPALSALRSESLVVR